VKFCLKVVEANKIPDLKSALCLRAEAADIAGVITLKSS